MATGSRPDGLHYLSLQFDPHKPGGRRQQAPLTPEYQTILEANMADQELGGQAGDPTYRCLPLGMPRLMGIYVGGMKVVMVPEHYLRPDRLIHESRRTLPTGRLSIRHGRQSGYSIGLVEEDAPHKNL